MTPTRQTDVVVIGGGPAGSTIAALLAMRGWRTVVLEKDHHPRFHIGESLLPLSRPLFERLGVAEEVERIGLRKYAVEFHSMVHRKSMAFPFSDALHAAYPYAYEVRRSELDHLLLRNCARKGAEVLEGWRVEAAESRDDALVAVTAVDAAGERVRWEARFYVDASGRDTFLASLFGLKASNRRHHSAALYGHFDGAERWSGRDEGNISIYWFEHGWFWMIPLKDGTMSVGAVCQPDYLKCRTVAVEQFFLETIALCPGVAARLRHARLSTEVTATGNYSYWSRRMSGRNYLLVGDAYAFIDPVFSSGVHLALTSAFLGADAVDAILRDPASAAQRLRRFERQVRRGLGTFSWFIYRIRTPAIREMFMYPRNLLGVHRAVVSVMAGDVHRSRLRLRLLAFRLFYGVTRLLIRLRGEIQPSAAEADA